MNGKNYMRVHYSDWTTLNNSELMTSYLEKHSQMIPGKTLFIALTTLVGWEEGMKKLTDDPLNGYQYDQSTLYTVHWQGGRTERKTEILPLYCKFLLHIICLKEIILIWKVPETCTAEIKYTHLKGAAAHAAKPVLGSVILKQSAIKINSLTKGP